MKVNIAPVFVESYYNTVKHSSEYVNIISSGSLAAIYSENKDIFYMSVVNTPFDENVALRLPTETANLFINEGTLEIIEEEGHYHLTHKNNSDDVTVSATIAHEYCNLREKIIEFLESTRENPTIVIDNSIFQRALLLIKASSNAVGVKGVQFKNNYVYTNANGYIAYMREPTGLSLVLSNNALKALSTFTRNAESSSFSFCRGYNLCTVGNLVMGWRKERAQDMYDLSSINYDYSSSMHTNSMKLLFQNIKSEILTANINFNTGYLTVVTQIGHYSLKLDIETRDDLNKFNLNINIIKDLIGSFDSVIEVKLTGTTLAFVNKGIHYFMGGC